MPENILIRLRDQLAQAIFDENDIARPPPVLPITPWLSMSLLQKSIRRGETGRALQAAATLMQHAPEKLWRRLGGIVFEDVGVADIEAISLTVAGLSGRRWRAEVGGEWIVAQYLVKRLAGAPKCRAVDHLFMLVERHPIYCRLRLELASGTMTESMELLRNGTSLEERALAIWSSNAFLREGHSMRSSRDPFQLFEHFEFLGIPQEVLTVCAEGYRKSRETLPLMFGLIYQNRPSTGDVMDDHLPEERIFRGVPMFVVDYFCREGREAYRQFLRTDCATADWIKANVPRSNQIALLGMLVFAVEGGQMRKRLRWELADRLRDTWTRECHGRYCPDATEILALLRQDLNILNSVRSKCLNS